MSFDEANTVRDGIRDHLKQNGWTYVPAPSLSASRTTSAKISSLR